MFDASKKDHAIEAVAALCVHCRDKHRNECPVAKAMAAVKAIPTA